MNLHRICCLAILLLVTLHLYGYRQQDSVLNRAVTVRADNQSVSSVLRQITANERIFFSYDASLVSTERLVSLAAVSQTVEDVLDLLFPHGEFRYIVKEDYIIITAPGESDDLPEPELLVARDTILTVRGRVFDFKTGEPLSYVSVSLRYQPIGTITNSDGDFILKLPLNFVDDTLSFSFVGYAPRNIPVRELLPGGDIYLHSIAIRIREVRVKAISVEEILERLRYNIRRNYPSDNRLLTGFYRETVKQDREYISVSEAVSEVLKASYQDAFREDKVRLLKARKSPDVRPFHWVNFKLQGGPFTITKLDAVKIMETFIDAEFQHLYRYSLDDVIWFREHPVYVVSFRPLKGISYPLFRGEMYIDRESFALVHARYSLDNYGLSTAEESLIRKKPRGFKVKPLNVDYQVDYQELNRKWYLHSARAVVAFRVRSREDRVNSVFESVSEMLVTDIRETDLKRFPGKELFTINDIFAEMSVEYDEGFWGNYNIIKPGEDLQNAIKSFVLLKENTGR